MAGRYVPNQNLRRELAASSAARHALVSVGDEVARSASARGRRVSPTYEAEAVTDAGQVRVVAATDSSTGIPDAAAWIEFGTQDLPASAPLRSGARDVGLELRG